MEEAPNGTIQEELDWGVRQLQTGLFQLELSPQQVEEIRETLQSGSVPAVQERQAMSRVFGDYRTQMAREQKRLRQAARKLTPAAIPPRGAEDCGSGEHGKWAGSCSQSQSGFRFNFALPEGASDDPIGPTLSGLNSDPSDSRRQQQAGSGDVANEDRRQSTEQEKLKIFPGAESPEPGFKFNFAVSEAGAGRQRGNCTVGSVPAVQSTEARANPMLLSSHLAEHLRNLENTASKLSQKKKKNKEWSSKPAAEPVRDGERRSGDSDGRERNTAARGDGRCLSSEEQLRREVDWCIEQLELGLRTQKTNQKQADGALRALRTLRSGKAPLVKKRQVMRSIFGDYRKKMEDEREKQFTLMLAATKSADIKPVGEQTRSKILRKSVNKLAKGGDSPESGSVNPEGSTVECASERDTGDQGLFRFNFF
uniref:UPF0488 protein C8orf33 homolog n=1 Tax=Pristiophorus japonicus TaxID=55135 RepID=UPI00398F7381